jgi:hypothetical protein
MRKAILMLILAIVSSSAAAEWLWLGVRESTTTYFDFSTISRANNMAKVWKLIDYQSSPAQNFTKPYKSHKEQAEFDCEKRMMRHVALIFYSDNMGEGEAVYTENIAGAWTRHQAGSIDDFLLKIACGKE